MKHTRISQTEKLTHARVRTYYPCSIALLFYTALYRIQDIDSHRFRDAIREAISNDNSDIVEYKMFTKWAKKIDATPAHSQDPLKPSKKKKKKHSDDTSALALAILGNRQKRQDDFMSHLEAKYGGGKTTKTKKASADVGFGAASAVRR